MTDAQAPSRPHWRARLGAHVDDVERGQSALNALNRAQYVADLRACLSALDAAQAECTRLREAVVSTRTAELRWEEAATVAAREIADLRTRLAAVQPLVEAAEKLALRTLEYVTPPTGAEIEEFMECDREMKAFADEVIALIQALPATEGEEG